MFCISSLTEIFIYCKILKYKRCMVSWIKISKLFYKRERRLYSSYFSKTVKNDQETLQFVKKITNTHKINFRPIKIKDNKLNDTVGIIIAASGNEKRWSIKNYIKVINFLIKKGFKKFLIISGIDQSYEENLIKDKFRDKIELIFTSNKTIKDVIPYLSKCIFCIGNDTGFAHLSINFDVPTLIIHGDCPPQSYSNLIYHIDIDKTLARSSHSIQTITIDKVLNKLSYFLNKKET